MKRITMLILALAAMVLAGCTLEKTDTEKNYLKDSYKHQIELQDYDTIQVKYIKTDDNGTKLVFTMDGTPVIYEKSTHNDDTLNIIFCSMCCIIGFVIGSSLDS